MNIVEIKPENRRGIAAFARFPYDLYRSEKSWVPPFRKRQQSMLRNGDGMQLSGGPFKLFAAFDDGRIRGRLLAGVNRVKNKQKALNDGYLSLFECEDDSEVSSHLFAAAENWLIGEGVDRVTGPVSPTNGDDLRGVLLDGFGQMPAINTTYTKPYYPALFESSGYEKYIDFYAFHLNSISESYERVKRIVDHRAGKMELTIRPLDLRNIESEAAAIHFIFAAAARESWEHLETPSTEQILGEFSSLKTFINPDLVLIARIKEQPVAMVVAIPDYNEVLVRMNGSMSPLSILKFLVYRRKIRRIRAFMQFAVPKYQGSAVMPALYFKLYENTVANGFREIEGSTIAEMNLSSFGTLESVGFEKSRTYRIYQKTL